MYTCAFIFVTNFSSSVVLVDVVMSSTKTTYNSFVFSNLLLI